jgi:Transposase DDE domain
MEESNISIEEHTVDENWPTILQFLPTGWEEQAKALGALRRLRKIVSAERLLRVLMIHLVDGCSLRETVARAGQGNLAAISAVALFKRLKAASQWLRWLAVGLLARQRCLTESPKWLQKYRLRCVDATVVCEPGSSGTDWRLHYGLDPFQLSCQHFLVTQPDVGESFTNFPVGTGDILIGDRVYGALNGMRYVKKHRGDFIVRLRSKAFRCRNPETGEEMNLLTMLGQLPEGAIGDWAVEAWVPQQRSMRLRICGIRKSKEVAEEALKRAIWKARDKGQTIDPETLELQRYVVLATSLTPEVMSAEQVTECYRIRWQIEIAFKRLKSLIGLSNLPKLDKESARAWLHGKVFAAFLVQALVDEGRHFFPWGYPVGRAQLDRQLVA